MTAGIVIRACRWVTFNQAEARFTCCPNNAALSVLENGSVTCELTCGLHQEWSPSAQTPSEREHFDITNRDDIKAAMIRLAVAVRARADSNDELFAATVTARTLELIELHRRAETRRHELIAWNKTLGCLSEQQKRLQREMDTSAPLTRRHVGARRELAAIQRVLDSMQGGPDA